VRDSENNLLIIDSGSGMPSLKRQRDRAAPAHLLITHTHLDHIQGFLFSSPHSCRALTSRSSAGRIREISRRLSRTRWTRLFPIRPSHMPAEMESSSETPGETFEVGACDHATS
jgi:glyoxylase-like metal-dependent hydrolase (beta-lactamase superfamily II)